MKPLTILRAAAWLGFVLVGWSLNLRWGANPRLPVGPPAQFERPVVGALLLAFVAAFVLSVSGAVGKGRPPALWSKAIALLGSLGAASLVAWMHVRGPSTALDGSGWLWTASGAALVFGAAVGAAVQRDTTLVVKNPPKRKRR